MKLNSLIFAGIVFWLLAPTVLMADERNGLELRKIELANPEDDLRIAIAAGDLRFIALMGYSRYVPGVLHCFSDYERTYGYKIVKGTSDSVENYEQGRLTAIAEYYAKTYNLALADYIGKNGLGRDGEKCIEETLR